MRTTATVSARLVVRLTASALVALVAESPALACVVGTGSGVSCTETALNACLPGGGSFDGSVTFNCGGVATIALTSTKTISANTTVDGGGVITLQNSGSASFSVSSGVDFVVQNLTLSGPRDGIDSVNGTVTATDCTFTGNSDGISAGGPVTATGCTFTGTSDGISAGSGMVTATDCTFTSNSDGISAGGTVVATRCTFSGNSDGISTVNVTATDCTFADNDDGISASMVTATGCTFTGNVDGISTGSVTVANSTFVNNSSDGISTGSATVTNCTFANNPGLGISAGPVTMTNTILASSGSANCSATVTDGGHNIDDGTTCGFTGTGCAVTTGTSSCHTNPQLDAAGLADNGGPTKTIALAGGSPAIDHGDPSVCAAPPVGNVDQRGVVRAASPGGPCDIGAFEVQATTTTTTTPSTTTTLPGACSATPAAGCRAPAVAHKGLFVLRRGRKSAANLLQWRWQFGAATTLAEFGDPVASTGYRLCVYDAAGLQIALSVPAGGTCGRRACWTAGKKGFRYRNRVTTATPITDVILRAGAVRKATATFAARGSSLPLPSLPLSLPATIQLQADTGVCWATHHSTAGIDTSKAVRSRSD